MGLDWREATWWEYQAALSGWNEAHHTDKPQDGEPDTARLARALRAHASLQ
ncbi:hypothetical protein GCM10023232_27280 [Sphingosinicella ginsenosidimutans]|uniref:hypothetical protein n=1 Tax=Allosphingosinicella ginsenosidimutans TaxID=1176539 RepID=UPI0013154423|nr:hypothetical protein [Sphingosinicella ginsenosidimutans]